MPTWSKLAEEDVWGGGRGKGEATDEKCGGFHKGHIRHCLEVPLV